MLITKIIKKLDSYNNNGNLTPIDFSSLPFVPKRIFYVTDVPPGKIRGGHAHKECRQVLVCIKGTIKVTLYDGTVYDVITLESDHSVFVDKLVWDTYRFSSKDDVLMVLCSTEFDRDDYITEPGDFIRMTSKER